MGAPPPALASAVAEFQRARKVPGIVTGLVRGGVSSFWGFGVTAAGSSRAVDERTVFEVGSITKVFTAAALASLVADGSLALDDPIRPLLAARIALPAWPREVTFQHLATHTSTLPRASKRMMMKALRHPTNPYRDYGVPDLYADLAAFTPGPQLGRAFAYSNLGFGVLGHVLELGAGAPFEELVLSRVCRPLGLADTAVALSEEQRARLAQGYWFGKPIGLWDLGALDGAGALRSTAADLLRFVEFNLGVRESPLAPALRLAHDARVRASDVLSIGLAWHRTRPEGGGPEIIWHRGETGGMRSFIGFVPDRGLGLVLLSNSSAGVDELGLEVIGAL